MLAEVVPVETRTPEQNKHHATHGRLFAPLWLIIFMSMNFVWRARFNGALCWGAEFHLPLQ